MASLMMMPAPGFPMGIRHQGPPSNSSAPKYFFATSKPQSRNAPSVNFMMLPLCTSVTLRRRFWMAYDIALCTRRTVPERLTGLIPIPTQTSSFSGAHFLPKLGGFFARAEANLVELPGKLLLQKVENFLRFWSAGGVFDAGVNVFRVFAEDHHVHFLGVFDRRGDTAKVLNRSQTDEEIEQLPQGHIQRPNPAADRRGQRAFDADQIFSKRFHGVVRQPFTKFVPGRLAGEDFEPRNFLFTTVGFLHRGVEYANARRPDIRAGSIPANKGNNVLVGHVEFVGSSDLFAGWRRNSFVRHRRQL